MKKEGIIINQAIKEMKVENEVIKKLSKKLKIPKKKIKEAIKYREKDIRLAKTINLIGGIIEKVRQRTLKKIMKKLEKKCLNDLSTLDRLLS